MFFRPLIFFNFLILIFATDLKAQSISVDPFVRVKIQKNIKKLTLENYLKGVVGAEMPSSWPMEALKAQAVVARSYSLYQISQNRNRRFDVDSTTADQVYKSQTTDQVIRAVEDTEGLILKDDLNQVVKSFYHADCGGETIAADQVWAGEPSFGTARDEFCAERKSNKWTSQIPWRKWAAAFQQKEESFNPWFFVRGQNVFNENGQSSVQKLRARLGFNVIKSTPEQIQFDGQNLVVSGKGWGHGVGLCQWGARELAARGADFKRILSHYYPKARLGFTNQKLGYSKK